ncbi:radical SAM protein [Patescibacteria group bacterium]
MGLYEKISILGPSAKYDTCGPRDLGDTTNIPGVYHAKVSNGGICRLFKVLQTNACKNNCNYCAYRKDRRCSRVVASPDEMARAFDIVHTKRLVDGLFLSSGVVRNADYTMSRMLDTVHILRKKYKYSGYVHLKFMPNTPQNCIEEAFRVSNRVSLNIESPTENNLFELSPDKTLKTDFFDTLFRIKRAQKQFKKEGKRTPSLTTQFVVGAGTESDEDILKVTSVLYKSFKLTRVFYSAFRPVPDTPLGQKPAASLVRQHRLYQSDFLMRFYGFSASDLPMDKGGYLPEMEDPKLLWAKRHPEFFPININRADYWNLLKIPGIGPTSARKLIDMRRDSKIYSWDQLQGKRLILGKIKAYASL